jgi:hypothetical protein
VTVVNRYYYEFLQYVSLMIGLVTLVIYFRKWAKLLVREKDNPSRTVAADIASLCVVVALIPYLLVVPRLIAIQFPERDFQLSVLVLPAGIGNMRAGDLIFEPGRRMALLLGLPGDDFEIQGGEIYLNGHRFEILGKVQSHCNLRGRVLDDQFLRIPGYLGDLVTGKTLTCDDVVRSQPNHTHRVIYAVWPPRYFGLSSSELARVVLANGQ